MVVAQPGTSASTSAHAQQSEFGGCGGPLGVAVILFALLVLVGASIAIFAGGSETDAVVSSSPSPDTSPVPTSMTNAPADVDTFIRGVVEPLQCSGVEPQTLTPSIALDDLDELPFLHRDIEARIGVDDLWFGEPSSDIEGGRTQTVFFGQTTGSRQGVTQLRVSWDESNPDSPDVWWDVITLAHCIDSSLPATTTTTTSTTTTSTTTTTIPDGRPLPDFAGQSIDDAILELFDRNLTVSRIDGPSNGVPIGQVIGTDPPAGTIVAPETNVVIIVSSGPPTDN